MSANLIPLTSAGGFSTTGNITAGYLVGNGVSITGITSSSNIISNGTSNVSIPVANGNITINSSNGDTWNFDNAGNLTVPGNIVGAATVAIDNRASGNGADINLYAADDITIQARDRVAGSTSEGGDINIFAGDSAEDSDSSGGDIQIIAGDGGNANVDFGGNGGTITIQGGQGGAASTGVDNYPAQDGGLLTLRAGDAGNNNGNIDRGADGGAVLIEAGDSTGNGINGGGITLTTGLGGTNALAGYVEINIPSSDLGAGGAWIFTGTGNLNLPTNGSLNLTGGGINQDNNETLLITTFDDDGIVGSSLELEPGSTTRLEQWSSQQSDTFTTADWATGTYTNQGGMGKVQFIGAANIIAFIDSLVGTGHIYFSVNGGTQLLLDGTSSGGGNITFFTPTLPAVDPTVVTSFEYFYSYQSGFEILSGEGTHVNIYANDADITLETTGQRDISLDSSGDVILTANSTVNWTFATTGNLTLPGNTFAVNYANGTQVSIGGGGANTGNVTFNDQAVIGTGDQVGGSGLYLAPGTNSTANLQYLRVRGGDVASHIHLDTGNNAYFDQYFGDDSKFVKLETTGNVKIGTSDFISNSAQWTFGTDSNLTLPQGTTISDSTDIVTVTLDQFTDGGYPGTQVFTKVSDTLYELSPGGPYMTLISSIWYLKISVSTYYNSTDLITWETVAGGLPTPVGTLSSLATMNLGVGVNTWAFGEDGNLTLPGGSQIVDTPTGVLISGAGQTAVNRFYTKVSNTLYQTVDAGVTYNIIDQAGIWSLDVVGEDNPRYTSVDLITWADAGGGLPAPSGTIINGLANITVNGNTWTFGANGNLTLPANGYLRVTSGIVGTGASPAPSLSGFGSVSALNLSATGNVTGNNLSTSGNVSTGNLNLPYGATVSITESTTTSGALTFDGTTSYLTVPSSANYAMGTTWTIEFWINADSASTGLLQRIIMQEQDVVALSYIAVSLSNGNLNVLCTQNNSVDYPEPTPGVWTHVAIVNDNSSSQYLYVYYNGVLQTNPTGYGGPANYQSSNAITVGRFPGSNFQYFPGSLADIRITSGIAVYTGAFTVPTSVLTVTQPAGTNIAAIPTTASVVLLLGMLSSATAFDDSSFYNSTVTNSGSTFTTSGPGLIGGIGAGVVLKSSAASGTVYNWTFDTAGTLTLPAGGGILGNTGISFESSVNGNASGLYTTGNVTEGGNTYLYATGNVYVRANNNGTTQDWTFGADGDLTFPTGNLVITPVDAALGNSAVIASVNNLITLSTGVNGGLSSLWVEDIGNVGTSNIAAVYANPTPGSKIVRIAVGQNGGNAGPNLWDFDGTGNLIIPGDIIPPGNYPNTYFTFNAGDNVQLSADDNLGLTGSTGNVNINANGNIWIFDSTGNATFPANGTTNLHDVVSVGLATFSNVQIGGNLNYEESANLIVVEDKDGFADIIAQNKNAGGNASMNIVLVNNDPGNVYMAMGVNSSNFTPLYNTLFEIPDAGYVSHSTTQVMGPQSSESGESRMFLTYSSGSYALELNDHGAIGWGASYNGNLTQGNFGNVGQVLTSAGANSPPTWNDTLSVVGNVSAGNVIVTTGLTVNGTPIVANNAANLNSINTMTTTGNVGIGGNLSVTGNITGNGAGLTGVAKQTVGLWTVTPGTATYSFTVPAGTYAMWVSGNIPNGIIVWNATATITNTNVPVVGQQYAWVYNGGGTPIDFVSIPNQFVGTGNAIVRSNTAPSSTTNRFDFSINNTSGGNANVSYGYTAL